MHELKLLKIQMLSEFIFKLNRCNFYSRFKYLKYFEEIFNKKFQSGKTNKKVYHV